MEVINCITLLVDRYASMVFLAFVGNVNFADVEHIAINEVVVVESVVDTEKVLDLQEDMDFVERKISDMEIVEFPRLR